MTSRLVPLYLEIIRDGNTHTLWCDCGTKASGRKRASDEQSDSDSDETPKTEVKRQKKSLSEEKNVCIQEIFEKLKAQHGDKYTGPQNHLWAEDVDVNQHSSYNENPQGSFCSAMQGCAHDVRKSGSSNVLTTAVIILHGPIACRSFVATW